MCDYTCSSHVAKCFFIFYRFHNCHGSYSKPSLDFGLFTWSMLEYSFSPISVFTIPTEVPLFHLTSSLSACPMMELSQTFQRPPSQLVTSEKWMPRVKLIPGSSRRRHPGSSRRRQRRMLSGESENRRLLCTTYNIFILYKYQEQSVCLPGLKCRTTNPPPPRSTIFSVKDLSTVRVEISRPPHPRRLCLLFYNIFCWGSKHSACWDI